MGPSAPSGQYSVLETGQSKCKPESKFKDWGKKKNPEHIRGLIPVYYFLDQLVSSARKKPRTTLPPSIREDKYSECHTDHFE